MARCVVAVELVGGDWRLVQRRAGLGLRKRDYGVGKTAANRGTIARRFEVLLIVYDDTRRRAIEIELLTAERLALARYNRSEEQEHFTGQYSASRPEYSSRHSLPQTLAPVQSF